MRVYSQINLSPQVLKVVVEVFDELVMGVFFFRPIGEGLIEGCGDGVDLGDGGCLAKPI